MLKIISFRKVYKLLKNKNQFIFIKVAGPEIIFIIAQFASVLFSVVICFGILNIKLKIIYNEALKVSSFIKFGPAVYKIEICYHFFHKRYLCAL